MWNEEVKEELCGDGFEFEALVWTQNYVCVYSLWIHTCIYPSFVH